MSGTRRRFGVGLTALLGLGLWGGAAPAADPAGAASPAAPAGNAASPGSAAVKPSPSGTVAGKAASAAAPVVVVDFSREADVAAGPSMAGWFKKQGVRWQAELGTPSFFSIEKGAMRLVAKRGPLAGSWNPANLAKREDKVILRITPQKAFRVAIDGDSRLEVTMAPLRLPGKGADLTDSARNDAAFYLLVSFDGPLHSFHGSKVPDTIAYVWADGPWQKGGQVGRDPDYDTFMRYIALGRGADRLGELRTLTRNVAEDFRRAFPERASTPVPPVVQVGVMIDSNTLDTQAESLLRSVRFLP